MRLPNRLRLSLLREIALLTEARRPPDMVIGEGDTPYLRRWYVIPRNKWFNVYFHNFCRSDDDRALHDHPWRFNLSVLLLGSYIEEVPADAKNPSGPRRAISRPEGSIVWRLSGRSPHRVMLYPLNEHDPSKVANKGWNHLGEAECCTLFITGANVRTWGFWCPGGRWVPWQKFTAPAAGGKSGAIGAGCGED